MTYEIYLLIGASFAFLFSMVAYFNFHQNKIGKYLVFLGIALQFILLVSRSYFAKHPPFTNLYETMILLPFLFSLRLVFWKKQVEGDIKYGVITLILVLNLVAILMSDDMKVIKPLMPALNSFWMYIHVPAYFVAYSSMLVATILAVFLFFQPNNKSIIKKLDEEVKIAFFFLNAGLITGAVWAYFSWGTYWGWDPKEVWSLINILVLSYYFHVSKKEVLSRAAIVIITFLTIIFTYFGVTFILTGLHSYT
jgi:ABC-type transport system involved in cytochrome c biogenesis permease subunit